MGLHNYCTYNISTARDMEEREREEMYLTIPDQEHLVSGQSL